MLEGVARRAPILFWLVETSEVPPISNKSGSEHIASEAQLSYTMPETIMLLRYNYFSFLDKIMNLLNFYFLSFYSL